MPETPQERVARYVRARREELGLTQEDVATRGGPSTATLRLIEGASLTTPRPKSLRQLETALYWGPGSALAIYRGGEPVILDSDPLGDLTPEEIRMASVFIQVLRNERARGERHSA
jgi:transcriptional regulator with XRE-family HTH domain